MKSKTVAICLLSTSILIACGNNEEPTNTSVETEQNETQEVVKNESVKLPVTIFENSDYDKNKVDQINFKRIIESAEITDFTENDDELAFKNRYGNVFESYNLDLIKNYRKLTIKLSHNFEGTENYEKTETFILDKNTNFVAGDYDLIANDIVNAQLDFLSTDFRLDSTYDLTNEIVIAVPNEFISEHLQLKTVQDSDGVMKTIYIDLVK